MLVLFFLAFIFHASIARSTECWCEHLFEESRNITNRMDEELSDMRKMPCFGEEMAHVIAYLKVLSSGNDNNAPCKSTAPPSFQFQSECKDLELRMKVFHSDFDAYYENIQEGCNCDCVGKTAREFKF